MEQLKDNLDRNHPRVALANEENVFDFAQRRTFALPPNNAMELTVKSVTPFARGRAKGAPLFPAAHRRR